MTRDPFDRMKNSNPVPPDMIPTAPMSMAERIVGARAGGWPAWALTAVTAIAVLVVGLGSVWLLGGDPADDVAGGDTTTSAVDGTATTAVPTTADVTTTVAPPLYEPAGEVAVYLLIDDPTATGASPALVPTARTLAVLSTSDVDEHRAAIGFLLTGPTPGERDSVPMLSTAIPDGTRLLDLTVADGIATVDLSAEFATGSGSLGEIARIEQVLYTLTRFDDVDGMRLEIEGEPVSVFGSHGIVLADPVVRTDFDTLLPAVLIEYPAYGGSSEAALGFGIGSNPLIASGTANVFEATVSLALTDADGLIIWEGFTNATCGTGCRGAWEVSIPYVVDAPQMGSLIAWESSARDGAQTNVREHPVWLVPADETGDTTTTSMAGEVCSGSLVTDTLIEQDGLSPQDAAMRSRIFYAATECDWDELRALQIEGFKYSFGENTDAITHWQSLEAVGEEPIRYLAELLNRPYGTQPGGENLQYFVWPSAFVTEWSQVPEKERDELRPLYGDEEFAGFADFGAYIGYRVGIIDGSWVYFVAGD